MTHDDSVPRGTGLDRRTVTKLSGLLATGSIAALAGCTDEGPGGDDEEEDGDEDDEENALGTDDDENATDEGDGGTDADEWADVDEIVLEGETQGWIGVEPSPIEDEENPTLVLTEGEEYEITWENADGAEHNLVIWDDDDELVEDYETELEDEEGEQLTLEVEATEDMARYVCEPHQDSMVGDIEIESDDAMDGDESGGDNETDDGTDESGGDNETDDSTDESGDDE